ncbi:TolC family protein [Rhodocytophaga rosea]|uniref:TolC family protein n=1 Tax=Rhodocytophaga rosea TaxID=2704465 RepID=A0A6C0GFV9_9BACT|nr:TolC family protein [Rhodocytophaga rosea]QHT66878.1 TolC family protein [Rhodocytophaga rosea]
MMNYRSAIFFLCFITFTHFVKAQSTQDTTKQVLVLTYDEAKAQMLKENLRLIAAYYDINMAEARTIQAKVWNNPYLVWNQGVYSVEGNDYFNAQRQALIQFEQIFSIAGKHRNNVKLAKMSVEMNKLIVEDILRSLMLELSNTYTSLNSLQQQDTLYEAVLNNVGQLIAASEQQLRTGAIAGNEVVRLRSELIAIQAQALQNRNAIEEQMKNMRILLNLPANNYVRTSEKVTLIDSLQALPQLISYALESRPDYRLKRRSIDYEKRNLKLQKSTSVPDIKFAYQPFDRGSNYVRPYEGFNIELPIPLFDRNQGRIKESKIRVKQAETGFKQQENIVVNEITNAYYQLINTQKGLSNYSAQFIQQLEELNTNATTNYNRRNISILEYIDQQRIYIQTKIQEIELRNNYNRSANQLNFSIGKELL